MNRRTLLGAAVLPLARGTAAAAPDRIRQAQNLRWGMFVCWSFSTFSDREWTRGIGDVSFFNPSGMDTGQWARVAKQAGMGYLLFLAKHHDGFCLWDTGTTNRKVTKSPLGKDVLAAVRESCAAHGIKLALYFSEGDWTWPGNRDADLKKAQLRELLTRYGPIEYFWFDHAQTDGGLSHQDTAAFVKQHQPDCLVGFNHGDRAGEIRIREVGAPGALGNADADGPHAGSGGAGYQMAEFAIPLLGTGNRWFYTNPKNDRRVLSPWALLGLYWGAVRHGNLFSLDVGPDRSGRLRPIDERTLIETGRLIQEWKRCV